MQWVQRLAQRSVPWSGTAMPPSEAQSGSPGSTLASARGRGRGYASVLDLVGLSDDWSESLMSARVLVSASSRVVASELRLAMETKKRSMLTGAASEAVPSVLLSGHSSVTVTGPTTAVG